MDKSTTTDSSVFPPGYGDFALLCSDGVVCHFPRYLLGYMSGFFKDMFDLPNSDAQSASPLALTEPSQTIELLLQHMDPKIPTPGVNPDTIIQLLEAARKYQVSTIMQWYEEQAQIKKAAEYSSLSPSYTTRGGTEPLLNINPLLVLYCALQFDLSIPGQLALKELTECDVTLLEATNVDLPLRVYIHGMNIRKARIELFEGFIRELAAVPTIASWVGDDIQVKPDTGRKTCGGCTSARAMWIYNLERGVRERPSWASFSTAYEASGGICGTCRINSWADYYRGKLVGWRATVEDVEKVLPEWPF